MIKKIIFSIIFIVILSIFFSNNLIKLVATHKLSKWTNKDVHIESIKLNFTSRKPFMGDLKNTDICSLVFEVSDRK